MSPDATTWRTRTRDLSLGVPRAPAEDEKDAPLLIRSSQSTPTRPRSREIAVQIDHPFGASIEREAFEEDLAGPDAE